MKISKGYYGIHTTFRGDTVFLRSQAEYIVALYLDHKKIEYISEPYTFVKYRPDFVLKSKNCIIEVKASVKDKKQCLLERRDYYNSLGYRFIVIGNYWHFTWLKRQIPNISDLLLKWKYQDRSTITMEGKNNPRYNIPCSEETKRLISQKAIERNKDVNFRKENSRKLKNFFASERGKLLRLEISKRNKKERVELEKNCVICHQTFIITITKNTKHKKTKKTKKTCSDKCRANYYSLRVKEGKIVLPKQNVRIATRGVLIRTLRQWINKAGLDIIHVSDQQNFLEFIERAKKEKTVSNRTTFTNVESFYSLYKSKDILIEVIKEYKKYGQVDFEKYGL